MKKKYYAIYKGDKFLYQGCLEECAAYLNVSTSTVQFYTTPTYQSRFKQLDYHNRLIIIKINEE